MIQTQVKDLFETGAHFGYSRSRRHPSATAFIFATKDKSDIFDLEKTEKCLKKAEEFVAKVAESGKQVLFVAGKHEASKIVRDLAEKISAPHVSGRWIGGTLTNFKEIRKRIDRLERFRRERDAGERDKYTKLERLMLDREIEELERRFSGLEDMKELPAALFVVDPRHEQTAVNEAKQLGIPIVALANSDCDFKSIQYPIPANDSVVKSISFFSSVIADSYDKNKKIPVSDVSEK
ncbi:30S ribosomal protein S2 [Candidatus Kaiserbacteria bacterium CG10_big_fil_rev_8_21_14_0_10_43_70]|uniref:Small ribosomal subunit protein uS2 n=1 Tax=Candidatus Kaiserbacteria bacterium CG10_big_fil_rev_8_21_14_0_10_43_70 TaxID=1974605 RepID=A0A2H0UIV2_9BACT|nr:MAG: 30S ribosomal protein S2 [Candidatus Kaiserbacteria bacterium CG10_big_fil_rev_8_21_14_0_10_43_70]